MSTAWSSHHLPAITSQLTLLLLLLHPENSCHF
jgi:hypothetical protein